MKKTSVCNQCQCSFYCALPVHVLAPIGGHLQVVSNTKNTQSQLLPTSTFTLDTLNVDRIVNDIHGILVMILDSTDKKLI
jgi:hypothetical protein